MAQITGGLVRYQRRVKTGEYEHKDVVVELSFSVADGEDYKAVFQEVGAQALSKANQILFEAKAAVTAATPAEPAAPVSAGTGTVVLNPGAETSDAAKPKKAGRPPKQRAAEDPAAIDVVTQQPDPAGIDDLPADPGTGPAASDPADIGDLLGDAAPAPITDKELISAITQHNEKIKDGPAIRALVGQFVEHPKTARDIGQDKRQEFLDQLHALKA